MNSLENFDLLKTVGTGTFSRVYLCQQRKHLDKYFAVKILPINDVIKNKQVQHVRNEKEVLKCGGELFTFMRMYERLSSSAVRFYTSEIVSALSYLHSVNIVYRDLKPENILLDRDGHVVITDFGFAKLMSGESWTMCGTPEYLAPEMLQGRSHSKSVDWWSLGILMYEMLHGHPPFMDTSLMGLYEKIVCGELVWRTEEADDVTRDLVTRLLITDDKLRLGSGAGGAGEVKDHKYFKDTDWSVVSSRGLTPPILPHVTDDHDTRYFNFYQENNVNINDHVSTEDLKLFKDF